MVWEVQNRSKRGDIMVSRDGYLVSGGQIGPKGV